MSVHSIYMCKCFWLYVTSCLPTFIQIVLFRHFIACNSLFNAKGNKLLLLFSTGHNVHLCRYYRMTRLNCRIQRSKRMNMNVTVMHTFYSMQCSIAIRTMNYKQLLNSFLNMILWVASINCLHIKHMRDIKDGVIFFSGDLRRDHLKLIHIDFWQHQHSMHLMNDWTKLMNAVAWTTEYTKRRSNAYEYEYVTVYAVCVPWNELWIITNFWIVCI